MKLGCNGEKSECGVYVEVRDCRAEDRESETVRERYDESGVARLAGLRGDGLRRFRGEIRPEADDVRAWREPD